MKHAKLLTASIGFLVSGALACVIVAWWFPRGLKAVDSFTEWVAVVGAGAFGIAGLWWALRGVRGLVLFLSPIEEEKIKWEEEFSRDEGTYRGGSKSLVIALGCVAIVCFLLVGLFLR